MTYQVEVQKVDGSTLMAQVNQNVFEILKALHEPPYIWDELLEANRRDAREAEEALKDLDLSA